MVCLLTSAYAEIPAISAGTSHTVSLKSDGSVRTWGEDSDGQLGIGRAFQSATPILSLSVITEIDGLIFTVRDGESCLPAFDFAHTLTLLAPLIPPTHYSCHLAWS